MADDTIRKIEEAQERLHEAQAAARKVIQRQQAQLEQNRRTIDRGSEQALP